MRRMGVQWTKEQQQVIDKRDANILVAAAAGSGKTAVLVERIITRLTKDENPLNVDELLIVTFTEAAAAEMKERILVAIEKALEEKPNDAHLQKQATLIHSALITTIHSFCLAVIRNHFHTIGLDPTFRIGEDGELKLLKQDTLNQLLEEEYKAGSAEFKNLVECVAPGRSDKKLEELILTIYEFSRSNPRPEQWLDECLQKYNIQTVADFEQSSLGKYLIQVMENGIDELIDKTDMAIKICQETDGPYHYEDAFVSDENYFNYIKGRVAYAKTNGLSILEALRMSPTLWEPFSKKRPKDVDKEKRECVKAIRDKNKKIVNAWLDKYFYTTVENQVKELGVSYELIKELVRLAKAFARAYEKEKQGRGVIDFGDMEQYALRILTEEVAGQVVPSKVAREYQEKFAEVMIDEYQDSNLVQEAILTSVSKVSQGTYNVFMVGDVKQSIYRFRLSRPELFMEKFNTYQNANECRIDLNKNFRSRDLVLDSTNYVFYQIMKTCLGGVQYDKASALYCGASYPEIPELEGDNKTDNKTELLILDEKEVKAAETIEENSRELEARLVARRIKELVGNHMVYERSTDSYRPCKYSDIVLLSRSLSGWSDVFSRELTEEGVPTSVENREGYFSTLEVSLLLDYLRVLDNPKQDIPLTAVLRSMFGQMTDCELAMVKGCYKGYSFSDAVYEYAGMAREEEEIPEGIDVAVREKLRTCLMKLEDFRKKSTFMGIHELLFEILQATHYREFISALPGGEQRGANVDMLLEKATAFEKTSYKGIFNFIRYIEQLEKYQVEYGEANMIDELEDAVRIMSIHKSKGLEFPIVFVVGMGKLFNKRDQADTIVLHQDEGIAIESISAVDRTRKLSIMKQIIKKKMDDESLGEELRVLYVAMTRAKEKLIMTGKLRDADKALGAIKVKANLITTVNPPDYLDLVDARSYLDWVLMSVYLQPQAKVRVEKISLKDLVAAEVAEEIAGALKIEELSELQNQELVDEGINEKLVSQLEYHYPWDEEQKFSQKMSVTEIKRQAMLLEDKEVAEAREEGASLEAVKKKKPYVPFVALEPEFIKKKQEVVAEDPMKVGAFRGTAYHKFMELWDFSLDFSLDKLEEKLAEYVKQKKMTQEMVECIEYSVLETFFQGSMALRMKKAAKAGGFYKEQPFVIGVPASQIYGVESEEIILVQGIIDVYFEEDGELVVLDYKTDKAKNMEELQKKYHAQLEYYEQALAKLTGKTVKEKVIYSLHLQESIEL